MNTKLGSQYQRGYQQGWKDAGNGETWLYSSSKPREWQTGWSDGRTARVRSMDAEKKQEALVDALIDAAGTRWSPSRQQRVPNTTMEERIMDTAGPFDLDADLMYEGSF